MVDLTGLSDDELKELQQQISAELGRRWLIKQAPKQADQLAEAYAQAIGRESGGEWVQPTGAHDAYPMGVVVHHAGKAWENLTPANVWEPGVSGWREQVADDPETGEPGVPEWVQPTGGHDAYPAGAVVAYNGQVWRNSHGDGNAWPPGVYGWQISE